MVLLPTIHSYEQCISYVLYVTIISPCLLTHSYFNGCQRPYYYKLKRLIVETPARCPCVVSVCGQGASLSPSVQTHHQGDTSVTCHVTRPPWRGVRTDHCCWCGLFRWSSGIYMPTTQAGSTTIYIFFSFGFLMQNIQVIG